MLKLFTMALKHARLSQTLQKHTLFQKKQEFGEEAGLACLQKSMNTDCQINHFCQVSAGYEVPELQNS